MKSEGQTKKQTNGRTAGDAGWHASVYNLMARVPDSKNVAIVNLFKGNCAEYTPIETYLLSAVEQLDENHPIIERFAKRGVIANFDAQITIDGMGATHDATRHLAGGGPTFERITANLRDLDLPFKVNVRHNVHEGNKAEMDEIEAFVKELAEQSGNDLSCYPAPVSGSETADARGKQVGLLCTSDSSEVGIRREAGRFSVGRGYYCGAHSIWSVGIDEKGNLQKCWEAVDKPEISFGTAHDWDPASPLATASRPDNLTMYLNTACPVPDDECRACVWLPHCVGGCPHKRLFDERQCVAFKDDPESYVLALHARIGEGKDQGSGEEPDQA